VFRRDLAKEVELHNTMLASLVKILEEKGVVTKRNGKTYKMDM